MEQGFDDQFDDGMMRTAMSTSRRAPPARAPRSVSEMRGHTEFASQGLGDGADTGFSAFKGRRPAAHPGRGLGPVGPRGYQWD